MIYPRTENIEILHYNRKKEEIDINSKSSENIIKNIITNVIQKTIEQI